jgi:glycine/D-amino acid oxidase-like deaminating enzyme
MSAKRPAPSIWSGRRSAPCPGTRLTDDVRCDVAIIGGGVAGVSTALHLAELGAKVRLLEQSTIGSGAAGRSSGFVNAGLWAMPSAVIEGLGDELGGRLLDLLGDAPRAVFDLIERHSIACDARQAGTLQCASTERGLERLRRRSDEWLAHGAALEMLDARSTAVMVGSEAYRGAAFDPRGGSVNPLAYVRGLAQAAIGAGAKLHSHSCALEIEKGARRWAVMTATGSLSAEWIVVSTDAYSSGAFRLLREEQLMLPYFNVATPPIEPALAATILPSGSGLLETGRVLNALRLDAERRLILGSVGALRNVGASIHRRWAKRYLRRTFPQLGDVTIAAASWGYIGLTPDRVPHLHLLAPNVLAIGGYNGRGLAAATVFGRIIASDIARPGAVAELPLPCSPLNRARRRRMLNCAYEIGAQLLHI